MSAVLLVLAMLALIAAGVVKLAGRLGIGRLWPPLLLVVTAPLEVYRTNVGPFNLSIFRLALLMALIALVRDVVRGRIELKRPPPAPVVAYVALIALQLISLALVTQNTDLGYRFVLQYVGGLAAAYVLITYLRREHVVPMAWAYVASALLPLLGSVWRVFSVHSGGSGDLPGLGLLPVDSAILAARETGSFLLSGEQRMQGTFNDPNHFGFFIATVFVVAVGLMLRSLLAGDRRLGAAAGLAAIASGIGVVGSYSRSAWILAAVASALLVVLLGRAMWTRRAVVAALVVTAAAAAVLIPVAAGRLNPSDRGTQVSNAEHGRTLRLAFDATRDHPLQGVGIGSYGEYAHQPALVSSAHSTVFTVAAELGLPGLALLLTVIVLTVWGAVRAVLTLPARQRSLVAACTAAFAGLGVANIFYEVWMDDFQWMLFGGVVGTVGAIALRAPVWRWPTVVRRGPRGDGPLATDD